MADSTTVTAPLAGVQQDATGEIEGLRQRREKAEQDRGEAEARRLQIQERGAGEVASGEQAVSSAMGAPMPVREKTELPQPVDMKSIMDPKQYEGLAFALIGMALVGGAVSRGNWLGVHSALNGALQGLKAGQDQDVQTALKEYDTKYKAAVEHERKANSEYDDALRARNATINQTIQRVREIAARNQHQDVLAATQVGSYDKMISQIDARIAQLEGVQQRAGAVVGRIQSRLSAGGGGNKNAPQTEAGLQLAADLQAMGFPVSFFGGKGRLYDIMAAGGARAEEVVRSNSSWKALASALRATTVREAGMERLTKSIENLEPKIIAMAQKVGISGTSLVNTPMNALRSKLGSGDLAELKTLIAAANRQYIEAVTMPGSNAQLHVSSQALADEILNSNMSVGQMLGSMRGMNTDIEAGRLALNDVAKIINGRIVQTDHQYGGRPSFAPDVQGGAPAPAPPAPAGNYTPSATARKYLEDGGGGKVPNFGSRAEAARAAKNGFIKDGDKITIGGKGAVWKD